MIPRLEPPADSDKEFSAEIQIRELKSCTIDNEQVLWTQTGGAWLVYIFQCPEGRARQQKQKLIKPIFIRAVFCLTTASRSQSAVKARSNTPLSIVTGFKGTNFLR